MEGLGAGLGLWPSSWGPGPAGPAEATDLPLLAPRAPGRDSQREQMAFLARALGARAGESEDSVASRRSRNGD